MSSIGAPDLQQRLIFRDLLTRGRDRRQREIDSHLGPLRPVVEPETVARGCEWPQQLLDLHIDLGQNQLPNLGSDVGYREHFD